MGLRTSLPPAHNARIAVNVFEDVETKPTAQSHLGTRVYRVGVLCFSLGHAIQAVALLPASGLFPSSSNGQAPLKKRAIEHAGDFKIRADQPCD
jgi:hypothetical protein